MTTLDQLVRQLYQDDVPHRKLGDVGTFTRGNGMQKVDLVQSGFPAIHYGQIHSHYDTSLTDTLSFVTPQFASKLRKAKPGDLVIATTSEDDAAVGKAVAWLGDTEVAVSGDAYIYGHSMVPKYVSYFFQSQQFQQQKKSKITGTKVKRISGDSMARIVLPVPPLEVQEEIVRVLDQLRLLEAQLGEQLRAELVAREAQYVHYRAGLLSSYSKETARESRLSDFLDLRAGRFISASEISLTQDANFPYPCYGGGGLRGYVATANYDGDYVLIGRQGALSGRVARVCGKFYATEHAVVVAVGPEISTDWVFHTLTYMNLNQYVSKGAQPGLAVGKLNALMIMVPPREEQARVAAVLDKMNVLVRDLAVALSAERKARRAQYEHYRDRLLTFEGASA